MRTHGRSLSKVIALLIVGGVAFAAGSAEAIIVNWFGMFGLAPGQTARLNVVNVATPRLNSPPDPVMPHCMGELMFLDGMGMKVGESMMVDLMPGHAMFLDLAYDALPEALRGATSPLRAQLRGVVNFITDPGIRNGCRAVVPTVEVYDNELMKTMFILGLTPNLDPSPHL